MYDFIEFIICYGEGITPEQMKEETREDEIVFTRQLVMYFAREFKCGTLAWIGKLAGDKDHATVRHAVIVINNYLDTDKVKSAKILYYKKLLEKYIPMGTEAMQETAIKQDVVKTLIAGLEKEISALESRCINLTLQLSALKQNVKILEPV